MGHALNILLTIITSYTLVFHPIALAQSDSSPPSNENTESESNASSTEEEGESEEAEESEDEEESEEEEGEEERGEEEEEEEEGSGEDPYNALNEGKSEDWLALASSLAAGFLAASIARNCTKKTLDASMVMAAGVAYLGAEIISTQKDKDAREDIQEEHIEDVGIENVEEESSEDENASTPDASGDADAETDEAAEDQDAQIRSLKDQEESYKELEGTAKTKKSFQFAAAGLFFGASGVAIFKWTKEIAQHALCQRALNAADIELPSACAAPPEPTCTTAATTCQTALTAFKTELSAFHQARNSTEVTSVVKMAQLEAFTTKAKASFAQCEAHPQVALAVKKPSLACLAYLTTLHDDIMLCPGPQKKDGDKKEGESTEGTDSTEGSTIESKDTPSTEGTEVPGETSVKTGPKNPSNFKKIVKKIFLKGVSFLVDKANAFIGGGGFDGLMGNMGIVGAGSGAALTTMKPLKEKFEKFVAYPRQRAVIWTAMGGVVTAAAIMSGNIEEELKENAKYTAKVAQQYRNRSKESKDGTINPFAQDTAAKGNQNISNESIVGGPINLGSEEDDGIPCLTVENQSGQCAQLEPISSDEQSELNSIDPAFANLSKDGQALANGLNNKKTVSSATLNKANDLSGRHAFAVKKSKQLRNIALQELSKDKKNGQNAAKSFENLNKGTYGFFKKSAANAFKKHSLPQGPLVASYGAGTSIQKKLKEDAKKEDTESKPKAQAQVSATGSSWGDKLSFGDKSSGGLNFGDEGSKKGKKKSKKGKKKKSKKKKVKINKNKVLEQGGINRNVNSDIFKTINLRYKKTLYPIVFGE